MANTTNNKKEKTKLDRFAEKFWKAFLFTKDGRPKSGYGVYTFFLAILMGLVYAGAIIAAIALLNPVLQNVCAAWLENLIESLCSAAAGAGICALLHYLLPDKKLMFGSYLWLTAMIIAVSICMLIFLSGSGATGLFFSVFAWFVLIPVGIGLLVSALLFKKDYRPQQQPSEEPEYMKYIRRK